MFAVPDNPVNNIFIFSALFLGIFGSLYRNTQYHILYAYLLLNTQAKTSIYNRRLPALSEQKLVFFFFLVAAFT